jgi:hypothetical protein
VINDRIEQFERPATTRPHAFGQRHILRRRHPTEAPANTRHGARDLRAEVAMAFRVLADGIEPGPAHAHSATFYRSSGQAWARALGVDEAVISRATVATAFGAMAHRVDPDTANEALLRFYRSSGHDWARALSGAA